MATLVQLVASRALVPIRVQLGRHEYEDRKILGFPQFNAWLHGPVMRAEQFYPDDVAPRLQARTLIKDFVAGKPFPGPRMFKKMSPETDDVWELRSPDLRFFGWFARKDCYIATSGEFFLPLKEDKSLYEKHRMDCIAMRNALDLDIPKYVVGAKENDVVSD